MNTKELVSIKITLDELLKRFRDEMIEAHNRVPSEYEFRSWNNSLPTDLLKDEEAINLFLIKTKN